MKEVQKSTGQGEARVAAETNFFVLKEEDVTAGGNRIITS